MLQYCVPITKPPELHRKDNNHIYDLHFLIDQSMESKKRKLTNDFIDDNQQRSNSNSSGDSYDGVLSQIKTTKRQKILVFEEKGPLKANDKQAPNFSTHQSFLRFDTVPKTSSRNYELRPRTFLRRPTYKRDSFDEDPPSVDVISKRKEKSAQRMSKYRRRTANARERHRMKEINDAFKSLREVLPQPIKMKESNLTKITTLRLAVDYIQALDDLLQDPDLNLNDPSFGSQGSLKERFNPLLPVPESSLSADSTGNSFNEFILGLSPASSPFSESLHESSLLSGAPPTPAHPVPAPSVPARSVQTSSMPTQSVPTQPLPSIPKNKDFKINSSFAGLNVNNYSFSFDDEALFPYEEDSSTIESIAILLSSELDDDVF